MLDIATVLDQRIQQLHESIVEATGELSSRISQKINESRDQMLVFQDEMTKGLTAVLESNIQHSMFHQETNESLVATLHARMDHDKKEILENFHLLRNELEAQHQEVCRLDYSIQVCSAQSAALMSSLNHNHSLSDNILVDSIQQSELQTVIEDKAVALCKITDMPQTTDYEDDSLLGQSKTPCLADRQHVEPAVVKDIVDESDGPVEEKKHVVNVEPSVSDNAEPSVSDNVEPQVLEADVYYCNICKISCVVEKCFRAHVLGKKHKKKMLQYSVPQISGDTVNLRSTLSDDKCSNQLEKQPVSEEALKLESPSSNDFHHGDKQAVKQIPAIPNKAKHVQPCGKSQSFYCSTCKLSCDGEMSYRWHLYGKKHRRNVGESVVDLSKDIATRKST